MECAKLRVLVVDDTAFMRKAVTQILETDPVIEVVDNAKDGREAVEKAKALKPDVITMDIDMPVMDGLRAIRHLMIEAPVPIVVLSSLVSDGVVTFEALRLGVMDFVPKPLGVLSASPKTIEQVVNRVKIACGMKIGNVRRVRLPRRWAITERVEKLYSYRPLDYIVVIGTTLNGPNTVIRILSKLSPTLPAAIVVMQEISPRIISSFVKRFNETVPWRIEEAKNGIVIEQGTCYIASNEFSLTVQNDSNGHPCLNSGSSISYPLDLLFSSAARIFRQNTIGILLSGLGDDGVEGFTAIKEETGLTIAKNINACVFPNLTDNVIRQGLADMVLSEHKITETLEAVMR
jgi:two-component system chemotaxis response regulator CheB